METGSLGLTVTRYKGLTLSSILKNPDMLSNSQRSSYILKFAYCSEFHNKWYHKTGKCYEIQAATSFQF